MQSIMCAHTNWPSSFCYVGIRLKELLQQNAGKLTSIIAMSNKLYFVSNPGVSCLLSMNVHKIVRLNYSQLLIKFNYSLGCILAPSFNKLTESIYNI